MEEGIVGPAPQLWFWGADCSLLMGKPSPKFHPGRVFSPRLVSGRREAPVAFRSPSQGRLWGSLPRQARTSGQSITLAPPPAPHLKAVEGAPIRFQAEEGSRVEGSRVEGPGGGRVHRLRPFRLRCEFSAAGSRWPTLGRTAPAIVRSPHVSRPHRRPDIPRLQAACLV